MKRYNYIYKITNQINGKIYIGKHSTDNLDDGYMGSGILIRKAEKKYGIENFTKEYLAFCDTEEKLNWFEKFYIKKYKARQVGYNLTDGGDGSLGHIDSDEARLKKSLSHKGVKRGPRSEETKQKLRKPKSEETKRKISEAQKQYCKEHGNQNAGNHYVLGPMTDEHKQKISKALMNNTNGKGNKGHHPSLETRKLQSEKHKGKTPWNKNGQPKYKWLTPDGEIKIMDKSNAHHYHKDWKLIEQV